MKKILKKIIAAVVVVGAFAAYVVSQRNGTQNSTLASTMPVSDSTSISTVIVSTPISSPISKPIPKPVSNPISTQKPKGLFSDGTYTGSIADAYFGPVQVKAVVTNGKLSNVIFLQYPSDRSTSMRKSQMAMPILKSEAILAQSAQVNTVSGATQTSLGFMESLQSALSQAKA